jgi:hypothetical protein
MRPRNLLALISICGLGCASYAPTAAPPTPALRDLPAVERSGSVAVGADAYTDPALQDALFDANLVAEGVLPVMIVVENHGEREVLVRRSSVRLAIPGVRSVASGTMSSVASRFEKGNSHFLATFFFGVPGALIADHASDRAADDRRADYGAKGFADANLAPGESSSGFVFFVLAHGTEGFGEADLQVRFVDTQSATSELVSVRLNDLGFPGVPLN